MSPRSTKLTQLICLLSSFFCVLFSLPAHSVPIVDGIGQLTGFTDVNVDGVLYDVEFLDGSCITLFSGCDDLSDFTFTDSATATAAAQALLDQVLLDGLLGMFDTNPALTQGCSQVVNNCQSQIPYGITNGVFTTIQAINQPRPFGADDNDFTSDTVLPIDFTTVGVSTFNFALFSLAGPPTSVPEPSTLGLLGVGLLGLAFARRKKAA